MKKISLILAILLTLALVLTGCGSKASNDAYYGPAAPSAAPEAAPDYGYSSGGIVADKAESDSYLPMGGLDIYNNVNTKVIRTANLTIQTTDFDAALEAMNRLTGELGGYFETAEVSAGGYYDKYAKRSAYYVVRIPKENFVAFRDGTGGIGHIHSISENTQDVGETYYDTEARLETLTTKRDRLLALLEKADVMEDIITLENALADVQYQIDKHTATLRKYDSLIGFSTFYIRLNEVAEITEEPSVKETFGSRFLSNLKRGFEDFADGLEDFAIWFARNLIGIIIFAAIVVVVVIVVVRRVKRRRTPKNTAE